MLKNQKAIDYLYGETPGISAALRYQKPCSNDWFVAEVLVEVMKDVLDYIKFNQVLGENGYYLMQWMTWLSCTASPWMMNLSKMSKR